MLFIMVSNKFLRDLGSLTNESGFLTPKTRTSLYLLHERLQTDTLLPHQGLLTHLDNHNPCHKPAIISCTKTHMRGQTLSHLMGSHGNYYHALLGTPQCIMGKGMCKVPKVKYCTLKCFRLASTLAHLTSISLVSRLPAELR